MKYLFQNKSLLLVLMLFFTFLTVTLSAQSDSSVSANTSASEFDNSSLKSFASVHDKVLSTQRQYRQEMMAAVKETGLSPAKFSSMLNYKKEVTSDDSDYTAEEKKAFTTAMKSLVEIQEELDREVKKLIENAGLTHSKYNKMAIRYEQSKEMRKQVKALEE